MKKKIRSVVIELLPSNAKDNTYEVIFYRGKTSRNYKVGRNSNQLAMIQDVCRHMEFYPFTDFIVFPRVNWIRQ